MASLLADSWRIKPKTKTITIPASAKTSGSGNQRSLQVASANPKRAKPLSCSTGFVLRPDDTDWDGINPPCLPGIRLLYCGRIAALARPLERLPPGVPGPLRKWGKHMPLASSLAAEESCTPAQL